mgnify:CR=1 FL=1
MIDPDITRFHDAWRTPEIGDARLRRAVTRVTPDLTPDAVISGILDHLRTHGPCYAKDLLRTRFQHGGQTPQHLEWPVIVRFMIQRHDVRKYDKPKGLRDGSRNRVALALSEHAPDT